MWSINFNNFKWSKRVRVLEWERVLISYLLVVRHCCSIREITLSHGLISDPVHHQHPDRWPPTHNEPHHLLQVLPLHHLSIHLDNHVTFTESRSLSTTTCCHLLGWRTPSHYLTFHHAFIHVVVYTLTWIIYATKNFVNITICPLNHLTYTLLEGYYLLHVCDGITVSSLHTLLQIL